MEASSLQRRADKCHIILPHLSPHGWMEVFGCLHPDMLKSFFCARCGCLFLGVSVLMRGFPSCGEWGLLSSCSAWAYYCSDFFCCRAWALGHEGSVAVTHELISSAARGILPDQGSHLCPLHWQLDSQQLIHQGSPSPSF